jgi:hypothetical protein
MPLYMKDRAILVGLYGAYCFDKEGYLGSVQLQNLQIESELKVRQKERVPS